MFVLDENVRKFCFSELHERWKTNEETYFGIVSFDIMPRYVRDQCAGFKARPRLTSCFRVCDD